MSTKSEAFLNAVPNGRPRSSAGNRMVSFALVVVVRASSSADLLKVSAMRVGDLAADRWSPGAVLDTMPLVSTPLTFKRRAGPKDTSPYMSSAAASRETAKTETAAVSLPR